MKTKKEIVSYTQALIEIGLPFYVIAGTAEMNWDEAEQEAEVRIRVECSDGEDLAKAINFANQNGFEISPRDGGVELRFV